MKDRNGCDAAVRRGVLGLSTRIGCQGEKLAIFALFFAILNVPRALIGSEQTEEKYRLARHKRTICNDLEMTF